MKWIAVFIVFLGVLVTAQSITQRVDLSKLVVRPETLVFFSGLSQEKEVLIYNFGNAPVKWSLLVAVASKFLKIDTSNVPNPLPPMSGAFLKVSINWDLVPTEAGTIEKPGTLVALLEKALGIDIPERYKHLGIGMFVIRNENTRFTHFVTVFTVMY